MGSKNLKHQKNLFNYVFHSAQSYFLTPLVDKEPKKINISRNLIKNISRKKIAISLLNRDINGRKKALKISVKPIPIPINDITEIKIVSIYVIALDLPILIYSLILFSSDSYNLSFTKQVLCQQVNKKSYCSIFKQ